ncbi:MAG TPA: MFS transporter [Syntrophorhabdales bacterium]|nr:MFS transporter [Syntrophorhabdales bacterium]
MAIRLRPYLEVYRSRRIGLMLIFGFSSGLPFALTGGTLQAWMTVSGVNLRTMGIFSAIGLPYALKFLWSPLMDRFAVPWLGRRRGWIVSMQVLLLLAIVTMAFASPEHGLGVLAFLAFSVAFFSASQDIVIDAYRTDLLQEAERGAGTAVYVTGYRIAMLVSGAGALIVSERAGWRNTYLLMAFMMVVGMIGTFMGPEPDGTWRAPRTLRQAVWGPLKDFFSRNHACAMLVFIVLYKLGDAYASSLTTAFLIGGMGFSRSDVGEVNKAFGMVSLIIGAGIGGSLMVRLGLFRALLYFGILQAVSILSFTALALAGKSYPMLVFAVGFENLTGGMGTSAFVAFLMGLCDHRYSATQFALLSSLAVLGRVLISLSSGLAVELIGWPNFFLLATLSALPGLALLWWMRDAAIFKH